MVKDKKSEDVKLVKCTNCEKAFYLKTDKKGHLALTCPYCEEKVKVKINGSIQYDEVA